MPTATLEPEIHQAPPRTPAPGHTSVPRARSHTRLWLALLPSRYMTQKKYALAKGDQIEVVGAKAQVDGHDVLVVREIKKGSETMTFRDAKGFPMWAGRRRR